MSDSARSVSINAATLSEEDLLVDRLAMQAISERLPRIRAAATAWGASVTAITALFGTSVVIDADDQVRHLQGSWGIAYGLMTALAILTAAAAIYLAALAAESRPAAIPQDVEGRARLVENLFSSAVMFLKLSRWLTVVAVMFLIASMGVRWYAPTTPSAADSLQVATSGT